MSPTGGNNLPADPDVDDEFGIDLALSALRLAGVTIPGTPFGDEDDAPLILLPMTLTGEKRSSPVTPASGCERGMEICGRL